jgi:hypothetical protein
MMLHIYTRQIIGEITTWGCTEIKNMVSWSNIKC